MKKQLLIGVMGFLLILGTLPIYARSMDEAKRITQFQTDLNNAYANYRVALFQTNKNDPTVSLKAAIGFQKKWNQLRANFQATPPAIYANDTKWSDTLEKVSSIIDHGIQRINDGDLTEAHEILEEIRDELGALRQRNGVINFSDYINQYHEKMEEILDMKISVASLKEGEIVSLGEQLAVLEYLAVEIERYAPTEYLKNKEFTKLISANNQALKDLRASIKTKAWNEIQKSVSALKPAYAKLFIKFG